MMQIENMEHIVLRHACTQNQVAKMSKMLEPTDELTAISACPDSCAWSIAWHSLRIGDSDISGIPATLCRGPRGPSPFRATAMELTASGIDVAAARNVTLDTIVGICAKAGAGCVAVRMLRHADTQQLKFLLQFALLLQ